MELPQVARVCHDQTVHGFVDPHVRRAILPLLDELVPAIVRLEVVLVLATEDDDSPSGTAIKEAISAAVAHCLATTFPTEAGVDERAQHDSTAPDFTPTHADQIGPRPGSVQWPLYKRVRPFTSHPFMVLQEGPQKMALPHTPIRLAPAQRKTTWGALPQKSENRIGQAEEAHPALKNANRRA